MRTVRRLLVALVVLALARPAAAQQRPLDTQDPETIGAGRVLIEGGVDFSHAVTYPLSGLKGDLWRIPTLGVNFGVGPIADLQIYGGPYDTLSIASRDPAAPLAGAVAATGGSTHAVDDLRIGMKLRMLPETAGRPSVGIRFFTRLPNAKHASGLGQDTTDFYGSLLAGKTVQSVRVVGNLGVAIMEEPLRADKQNDVLTYGLSFARAMTTEVELVGEFNGRVSTRIRDAAGRHGKPRHAETGRALHARSGAIRRRALLRPDDARSDDRRDDRRHLRVQRLHGAVAGIGA